MHERSIEAIDKNGEINKKRGIFRLSKHPLTL